MENPKKSTANKHNKKISFVSIDPSKVKNDEMFSKRLLIPDATMRSRINTNYFHHIKVHNFWVNAYAYIFFSR